MTNGAPITEHWYVGHWRPAMAWVYLSICLFDFILAPLATMVFHAYAKQPYVQWVPLTLQGGGLIHLSFGAIIGIYTYVRTQEKIRTEEDKMHEGDFKKNLALE